MIVSRVRVSNSRVDQELTEQQHRPLFLNRASLLFNIQPKLFVPLYSRIKDISSFCVHIGKRASLLIVPDCEISAVTKIVQIKKYHKPTFQLTSC